jgi:hypothetical protein
MPGANEDTFDIPESTFVQQRTTNVLPDIVPNQNQGDPIPTAEVSKRNPNIVPGAEWKHISPVRCEVKISLTIPIL